MIRYQALERKSCAYIEGTRTCSKPYSKTEPYLEYVSPKEVRLPADVECEWTQDRNDVLQEYKTLLDEYVDSVASDDVSRSF